MAFKQFKLDRATTQSRGIFDTFVYSTEDAIAEVQATGYFSESRFSSRTPDKWIGSFITCKCSDGVYEGEIDVNGTAQPISTGEAMGDVVGPASSVNSSVALFSGTTGKVIDEATILSDSDGRLTFTNLNNNTNSMNPITIVEVFEASDIDELATLGVVTISTDTFFIIKSNVTITSSFALENDAKLNISSLGGVSQLISSTTNIFISGDGSFRNEGFANLISNTGTTTFMDLNGGTFNATNSSLVGWADLGTFRRGNFFLRVSSLVAWGDGFKLEDCRVVGVLSAGAVTSPLNKSLFTYSNNTRENAVAEFLGIPGTLDSTASLLRISPALPDSNRISVSSSTLTGGSLFDESGIDGSFSSVADSSIGSTVIASVTNSSGMARFNHAGTDVFVNQQVAISDFVTNSAYNGNHIVSFAGSGFFELLGVDFGTDEAGSFLADSVTLSEVSTTATDGLAVNIETESSSDYDGGSYVFNQLANSFQISRPFAQTRTGSWSSRGLGKGDVKVLSKGNSNFPDSASLGSAKVNDNNVANGSITNGVFTDIVFGITGTALDVGTNNERWKLIDDVSGVFECVSNEGHNGSIDFAVTCVSSGGAQEFIFKWLIDKGAGYVDLDDVVETMNEIGNAAENTSMTAPLNAVKGDRIKPQITRSSGSSGVTIRYAQINIME